MILLVGCATTAKYEAKLNTWIGAKEEVLVSSWGVPDKTYTMANGKKAVEYTERSVSRVPGQTYTERIQTEDHGTVYVTKQGRPRRVRLSCSTTFIINQSGVVEQWQHAGNDCVAQ